MLICTAKGRFGFGVSFEDAFTELLATSPDEIIEREEVKFYSVSEEIKDQ